MIASIIAAYIAARTQRKVAKYSAEQAIALKDHEIKLSALHRARVNKLIEIFHALLDLEQGMFRYLQKLQHSPSQEEKEAAYVELYDDLKESHAMFHRHQFYFDEPMCERIKKVFGVLHSIEKDVYGLQYSPITWYDPNYSKEERKEMAARLKEAHGQIQSDLKEALHVLQGEIRSLLGVSRSAPAAKG